MADPEKQPDLIPAKDAKDTAPEIKREPAAASANQPVSGVTPAVTPAANNNAPVAQPETPKSEAPKPEAKANDNQPVGATLPPVAVKDAAPVETKPAEIPVSAPATAPDATLPAPANENTAAEVKAPEAAPVAEAPKPAQPHHSRKGKLLLAAFNFAAGFGVGYGVRTAAFAIAGAASLPVLLASTTAISLIMTGVCHFSERFAMAPKGQRLKNMLSKDAFKSLISKKNGKVLLKSFIFASAGGLLGYGLQHGWMSNIAQHFHKAAPPVVPPVEHVTAPVSAPVSAPVTAPVTAPVAVVAPVVAPVHCATPVEQFTDLIKGHHVSPAVTEAMHRAASGNAHVAAQGTKDLAYYAHNGFGGVPKDPSVANGLFHQAAAAGNTQAGVDSLYEQYYGIAGVTQNKAAALSAMKRFAAHSARAEHFTQAWSHGHAVTAQPFNADAVFKGAKLGVACPA